MNVDKKNVPDFINYLFADKEKSSSENQVLLSSIVVGLLIVTVIFITAVIPLESLIVAFISFSSIWILLVAYILIRFKGIYKHCLIERFRAEENERKFKAITSQAPDGISLTDVDGNYTFNNPALSEMTGYSESELLKMTIFDLKSKSDVSNVEMATKNVGITYETRISRKDGSEFDVEIRRNNVGINGQDLVLETIRDITKQIKSEEEIKLKNRELQKINAVKDGLFSIIAHDLRSPLAGFIGLTQIVAEELPSLTISEIQEIAVRMRKSATNLFQLLQNLLEWASIQKGTTPFEPKELALIPVVEQCISHLRESATIKGIQIINDISDEFVVIADLNLLCSVLRNLLSNAIKFTPKGGEVVLSAKITSNNSLEIAIKDNGMGMSPELVGQLFSLDYQTGRRGTEGEESTGLGLLLCKEFVEKHGGKIRVESRELAGSVFYFSVPSVNNLVLNSLMESQKCMG